MDSIKIFCPASVANLSCGYDILGLCLSEPIGDEMVVRKNTSGVLRITKTTGEPIPKDIDKNLVGTAAKALLKSYGTNVGFDIEIHKKIKPGSGMGSSAASGAGIVFAINQLLGSPFTQEQLVSFAMEGEKTASGSKHPDNVVPLLFGGITLSKSAEKLTIVKLPTPKSLFVTVVHPQIELRTADARNVLKKNVSLQNAVKQTANMGLFVSGLYTENYEHISQALEDILVEPQRKALIPKFDELKQSAKKAGALGSGISGSGPSFFALSNAQGTAEKIKNEFASVFSSLPIELDIHISKVNDEGIRVLSL